MNGVFSVPFFDFKFDMTSSSRDGFTWDHWRQIYVELRPFSWSKWSREDLYYDGPIVIYAFGPFVVVDCYDSSYHEQLPTKNIV